MVGSSPEIGRRSSATIEPLVSDDKINAEDSENSTGRESLKGLSEVQVVGGSLQCARSMMLMRVSVPSAHVATRSEPSRNLNRPDGVGNRCNTAPSETRDS